MAIIRAIVWAVVLGIVFLGDVVRLARSVLLGAYIAAVLLVAAAYYLGVGAVDEVRAARADFWARIMRT